MISSRRWIDHSIRFGILLVVLCLINSSVLAQNPQSTLSGVLTYTFAGNIITFTLPNGMEDSVVESDTFARSDDGQLLYVAGMSFDDVRGVHLTLLEPNGMNETDLVNVRNTSYSMDEPHEVIINGDGSRIAYVGLCTFSPCNGDNALVILDGSGEFIAALDFGYRPLQWLDDALIARNTDDFRELWVIQPPDYQRAAVLTVPRGEIQSARISPDGNRIVFEIDDHIWTAEPSESGEFVNFNRLTSGTGENKQPSWSPDGRWIIYISDINYAFDFGYLHVIAADGGEPFKLVDNQGRDLATDYHPIYWQEE